MESGSENGRTTWTSRYAYWMAAVGSAVGLGNIWRFPWRVFLNGGGAFIIAYFIVLFLVGMPMLTQEMALGQKFRSGDIEAYGRMHRRLRGIGLASVLGAMLIVSFYTTIIGWSVRYFVASFESPLPWEYGGEYGTYEECKARVAEPTRLTSDPTGPKLINDCLGSGSATSYFLNDVLKSADSIEDGTGRFAWEVFGCVIFVWIAVYLSICKGVKTVSIVVWVTMPLPVLFLIILLIKGLTLDGAMEGIEDLWDTDLSTLKHSTIWLEAITQCFFSLSVCMGIMTAYSSYNKSGSVALDEKVVAFWDVGIALMSSFVIYSTLGFIDKRAETEAPPVGCIDPLNAAAENCITPGPDTWGPFTSAGGGGLAFIAFPVALAQFEASQFFSALFFFALFTLGIDSAFSMIEATSTVITDSDFGMKHNCGRPLVSGLLCLLGFGISSLFCFDVGQFHIDVLDHWTLTRGMSFIGAMETFAVGWIYKIEDHYAAVGKSATKTWLIGYWGSLLIGTLVALLTSQHREKPDGSTRDYAGGLGSDSFWVGVGICWAGWIISGVLSYMSAVRYVDNNATSDKVSRKNLMWGCFGWYGAEDLRVYINAGGDPNGWESTKENECDTLKPWSCTKLSKAWGWLIKYFIPSLLMVLLMDSLKKDYYQDVPLNPTNTSVQFPWKYQIEGIVPFCLMIVIVLVIAIFPGLMEHSNDKGGFQATEMAKQTNGRRSMGEPV